MDPDLYQGREQTLLKHRVLQEYLTSWGIKLGSTTRKVWYVDCFAGPWRAEGQALEDTSPAVSLRALREAQSAWQAKGRTFPVGAVFMEPDDEAFRRLQAFVRDTAGDIDAHTFHGRFGDHVQRVGDLLGHDAAFIFVDPTGWKGADMKFIAALTHERFRDVMINVMFDFLNRARGMSHEFLQQQLRDFFGLDRDIPTDVNEEGLFALYRAQLKKLGGLDYAADVAVRHSTKDRTWFRLVVGGKNSEVLRLMRQVEKKVLGGEAGAIRDQAKQRKLADRTGQLGLPRHAPAVDVGYRELQADGVVAAEVRIIEELRRRRGTARYDAVWPAVLETCHITVTDLGGVVDRLRQDGRVRVLGMKPRDRSVKDDHMLQLVEA